LQLVRRLTPDVVLMDMAMPYAFDVAREVTQHCPRTRVVALAISEMDNDVIACAEVGVAGYVVRTGSVSEAIERDLRRRAWRGALLAAKRRVAVTPNRSARGGA